MARSCENPGQADPTVVYSAVSICNTARMRVITSLLLPLLAGLLSAFVAPLRAQVAENYDLLPEDVQVSYLYPAVMGTGTYKVDNRRISMLRINVAITQQEVSYEQDGMKWYAPVVIGYDQIKNGDWLGAFFEQDIATLTLLPGFEYQLPISETWTLKPFGHLGLGHDFTRHETIGMGVAGLRALGKWDISDVSEFRWGNAIRFAGEYQFKSERDATFTLIETGVDYRRDTKWVYRGQPLNLGVYYYLQHYQPEWGSLLRNEENSSVHNIHQVGVSVGLKKSVEIFGFRFSRVRFGVRRGDGGYGWSIGTEFPF